MPTNRTARRDEIVEAAKRLAARDGVGALTVRGVSAAAGIGVGTLRHYFPTQRALVDAVIVELIDGMVDETAVMDRDRTPGDRLAEGIVQFLPEPLAADRPLDAWFAFYLSALSSAASDDARRVVETSVRTAHATVRRWLEALAEEGAIEPARVPDTAIALIALVNGLMLEALTPGSPATVADGRRIAEAAARAAVERRAR